MSALTEAAEDELHDTLLAARARIEHLEALEAQHARQLQLAYMTGAAHGHERALRECIASLASAFGGGCLSVAHIRNHFNVQLVRPTPANRIDGTQLTLERGQS